MAKKSVQLVWTCRTYHPNLEITDGITGGSCRYKSKEAALASLMRRLNKVLATYELPTADQCSRDDLMDAEVTLKLPDVNQKCCYAMLNAYGGGEEWYFTIN